MNANRYIHLFIALTIAIFLCVAAQLHGKPSQAQPQTRPARYGIKSHDALASIKTFEAAESTARLDYFRVVDDARGRLIAALNASLDKSTKAGSLDEAVRIRDAIADLKTGGAPAAETESQPATTAGGRTTDQLVKALVGTKWVKEQSGFTVTFNADMSVTSSHHPMKGTWAAINGNTIRLSVSMNACSGSALTVSADGRQLQVDGKADFKLKEK